MKKLLYLFFLLFAVSAHLFAQNNVPAGIPKRVYYMQIGQYPKATDLVWKALPDGTYSVSFKINGKPGFVGYGKNYAPYETKAEIDSASLPRPVVLAIDSLYPGYKYKGVTHFSSTTPLQYEETFLKYSYDHYQVLVAKENDSYKLYFSSEGKLLNWLEIQKMKK